MRKLLLSLFSMMILSFCAQGQQVKLSFALTMQGKPLSLEQTQYFPALRDSIRLEALRFYVGNVQLLQGQRVVGKAVKKHLLVDAEKPSSLHTTIALSSDTGFDGLSFQLGTDSLTNVSGAFGGDLDPTQGMYWTWQSGYINVKIEGFSPACPTRKNRFQLHLGGYSGDLNTLQQLHIPLTQQKEITIAVAVDELLKEMAQKEWFEVMSPNTKAVQMARVFANTFTLLP